MTVDGIFGYGPGGKPGTAEGSGQGGIAVDPGGSGGGGRGRTGRWYRRGNRIVVIGV